MMTASSALQQTVRPGNLQWAASYCVAMLEAGKSEIQVPVCDKGLATLPPGGKQCCVPTWQKAERQRAKGAQMPFGNGVNCTQNGGPFVALTPPYGPSSNAAMTAIKFKPHLSVCN